MLLLPLGATAEEMAGVPDDVQQTALTAAQAEGKTGYKLTLKMPCYLPVMQFAHSSALRERLYRAQTTRASDQAAEEFRKFDISVNNIIDVSMLKYMQQLIYLNLAKNKIKALNVLCTDDMFVNLKWLDVSNNKITELPAFKLPKLEYLDIGYNKIEKVSDAWTGHGNIRILKSVDNKFKSISVFKAMPKLE